MGRYKITMAVINPPRLGLGWTLLAVIAIAAASSGEGALSASPGRMESAIPVKDIQSHNRQLASVDTDDLINLDLISLEEGEEDDTTPLLLRVFLGESNMTPPTLTPTGPPTNEEPCLDKMGTNQTTPTAPPGTSTAHCKNLIEDNPKICTENVAVRVQKCRKSCDACDEP